MREKEKTCFSELLRTNYYKSKQSIATCLKTEEILMEFGHLTKFSAVVRAQTAPPGGFSSYHTKYALQ